MLNTGMARLFLALNAAFSIFCGAGALLFGKDLVATMFVNPASWAVVAMHVLGVGLLGFAANLLFRASNPHVRPRHVIEFSIQDALWVLATIAALIWVPEIFTPVGLVTVIAVAIGVAILGTGQYIGARRITPTLTRAHVERVGEEIRATVSRPVSATKARIWEVMNDHPGYADVASNLARVEIIDGDGLGMTRECAGGDGKPWQETCTLFEPEQAFGFRVHTEAADYPLPFAALRGVWSIAEGPSVKMEFFATPKGPKLFRRFLYVVSKRSFHNTMVDLTEAWAARMERR